MHRCIPLPGRTFRSIIPCSNWAEGYAVRSGGKTWRHLRSWCTAGRCSNQAVAWLRRYEAIVAGNEATLMSAAFFDFVGHIATAAQDDPEEQERIIVTGNRIAAIHEAYAQAADSEAQLAEAQEKLQDVLKVRAARPPAARERQPWQPLNSGTATVLSLHPAVVMCAGTSLTLYIGCYAPQRRTPWKEQGRLA